MCGHMIKGSSARPPLGRRQWRLRSLRIGVATAATYRVSRIGTLPLIMCSQCLRAAARLFALRLFWPLQACLPLCFRTEKVPSCTCPHPVDIDCLRMLTANPPTPLRLFMHTRRSSPELADGEALRSLI